MRLATQPVPVTYRRAVKNIRAIYLEAPEVIQKRGINWYATANREAREIASMGRIPIKAACHLIAVLSPAVRWEVNLRDAKSVVTAIISGKSIDSFTVSTFTKNKNKAWEIVKKARAGEDYTNILSGQKVKAFAENIEHPDNSIEVTIDFHAFSIATGWRYAVSNIPTITPRVHKMLSKAYSDVGTELGLKAHQVQAVTWTWWRQREKRAC